MKSLNSGIIVILILSIIGCSTNRGFDRGSLNSRFKNKYITTDEDIQKILEIEPQLKFPFKLGIYLANSHTWSKALNESEIKNHSWIEELKRENIVSDVVFISNIAMEGNSVRNLRVAAARYEADAVLIVDNVSDVDRYNNIGSLLYLSIIGFWIIPGTQVDALVLLRGAMFDVHNEYLYLTMEAEGTGEKLGTAMFLKNEDALEIARKEALLKFLDELKLRLKNLKGI